MPRILCLVCVSLALLSAAASGGGCSHPEGDELPSELPGHDGGQGEVARDRGRLEGGAISTPSISAASRGLDAGTADLKAIADAGRFCGEKDLPDCPLQLWMKRNATPLIRSGETIALADAFDQMAAFAPAAREAYPNWGSIARDGAQAARVGDVTAAKAACRGCHTQYRARYHAELRALALPNLPSRQ